MHTLLVASRKGLFVVRGAGARWQITGHHFAGEPVTQVLADPRNGAWVAALRLGHFGVKLHKSLDQGASWREIAAPAFPAKPEQGPWADDPTPWSVDQVWALAAGGAQQPGTLWAGCIPAALFRSDDDGASWALNTALWEDPRRRAWMGGGYDHPGLHTVRVDPRDPQHLTLAISCGGVWQTHDGGLHWTLTAAGMKAGYMPEEDAFNENIQDVHSLAQCAAQPDVLWVQHHTGLYRSSDGGGHWHALADPAPSGFGFAVACDPREPRRAWFVPLQADAARIPAGGRMVVTRTDDGGESFRLLSTGLPQQQAFHVVYRHGLDVTPDGQTLAMASTTGSLWCSADAGEAWQAVSHDLPPVAALQFAGEA